MRAQSAWKVPSHRPSAGWPRMAATRSRISRAALLVKVTARTWPGQARPVIRIWAKRVVSTRVLPVPAPASTSSGPSERLDGLALLRVQLGGARGDPRRAHGRSGRGRPEWCGTPPPTAYRTARELLAPSNAHPGATTASVAPSRLSLARPPAWCARRTRRPASTVRCARGGDASANVCRRRASPAARRRAAGRQHLRRPRAPLAAPAAGGGARRPC